MRQNKTLALIRQGTPALGLWLHTHHFHTARALAAQGIFDWLLVDMEHTPIDLSMASMTLAAIADVSSGECTPIARVPHGTMFHIKQALDSGAQGVLVPMVNTAKDAADVVRFSRYPPEGERGGGGITPHYGFGLTSHPDYIASANREILVIIQIETREAVENIDSILAVPGIDLVFIGPFDLHLSLGLKPSLWSDQPEFQAAVTKVIAACKAHNMPYGTLQPPAGSGVSDRIAQGFTFIGCGTDLTHLLGSVHAQIKQVRGT
jgi:2-keto-3-deoxy-L-rhamnonate aldolase RhmA